MSAVMVDDARQHMAALGRGKLRQQAVPGSSVLSQGQMLWAVVQALCQLAGKDLGVFELHCAWPPGVASPTGLHAGVGCMQACDGSSSRYSHSSR